MPGDHPDAAKVAARRRRPRWSRSIYRRSVDGRWVGAVEEGDGRRRYVYGKSRDEVEQKLDGRGRRRTGRVDERRLARSRWIVELVLERAARKGWDAAFTARVVVASLSPRRARVGVVGPCFYCGDELAATVDHLLPRSRGGTDAPENVVSACLPCNSRKGDRTLDEFRRAEAAR